MAGAHRPAHPSILTNSSPKGSDTHKGKYMNLLQLKKAATKLLKQIESCADKDQEWTSPGGNGRNAWESLEAAKAFNDLIQSTK